MEFAAPEDGPVNNCTEDFGLPFEVGGQVDLLETSEKVDDGRTFIPVLRVCAAQLLDVGLDVPQVLLNRGLFF